MQQRLYGVRWQSEAATPLFLGRSNCVMPAESAVAASLCRRNSTHRPSIPLALPSGRRITIQLIFFIINSPAKDRAFPDFMFIEAPFSLASRFRLAAFISFCLFASAVHPQNTPATPPAPRHPSVVFILADDLGYGDLGCYGQTRIKTPNIDKLAAEGMRFTSCYAGSTVCAPSRCTLMTGLHTRLRHGEKPAEALRGAILSLMKDERYRHPMYWSAFVSAGL